MGSTKWKGFPKFEQGKVSVTAFKMADISVIRHGQNYEILASHIRKNRPSGTKYTRKGPESLLPNILCCIAIKFRRFDQKNSNAHAQMQYVEV